MVCAEPRLYSFSWKLLDNSAGDGGGGIYNNVGTVVVANSQFTGDSAYWGGGFCNGGYVGNDNCTATLTSCIMIENSGGDTYNVGTLTIIPATPSFSDLSLSQTTVTYGAGGSGDITASGLLNVTGSDPLVTPGIETSANVLIEVYNQNGNLAEGVQSFLNSDGTFSHTLDVGILPVGSYTVEYNYAGDTNFNAATTVSMNLTVDAAPLTITAKDVSSTYGDGTTLNGTGFTSSGLVNGETIGSVTLATNASLTAGNWNAGGWMITPSDAVTSGKADPNYTTTFAASNYSITYATTGVLTVAKADAVVTITNPVSGDYNGLQYTATVTSNSSDVVPTLEYYKTDSSSPTGWDDIGTVAPTDAGYYRTIANYAGSSNYNSNITDGCAFTIEAKAITGNFTVADKQ